MSERRQETGGRRQEAGTGAGARAEQEEVGVGGAVATHGKQVAAFSLCFEGGDYRLSVVAY